MPPIKRNVDRYAIQEALRDLETSIEAYLVGWRRELGIQRVPKISTDLKELRLEAIERKEQR
jgi:phage gp36-like protein